MSQGFLWGDKVEHIESKRVGKIYALGISKEDSYVGVRWDDSYYESDKYDITLSNKLQTLSKPTPMDIVEEFYKELNSSNKEVESRGGPSKYYDMPFRNWVTTNDMMEHLAEHKWGKYGIHLKDIFKGLCRWGDKKGTDTVYDARKIIYYGVRVLRMLVGVRETRAYLQSLLDDEQFKEKD